MTVGFETGPTSSTKSEQTTRLVTQIDHEMFINLSFPLEAGREQEHPVVNGDHGKSPGSLDIQLLRWDKLAPLGVPLVELCQ